MVHFKSKTNVYLLLTLLLSIGLFIAPNIALAADTIDFSDGTPVSSVSGGSGDISVYILQILFGGMALFGGGSDGLQDIFYVFNTGLWLLAGIFAAYVLATVILASRAGEVGGRQFNVFMMTIRTAFGTAMIVPTANGYALIQVLTMWLILQGVALSDVIWGKFASSDTLAKSMAVSPATPNTKALVKDVLIASLCMSAVQAEADLRGDSTIKMGWNIGSGDNFTPLDFSKRGSNAANGMLAEMVKKDPSKNIILRAGSVTGSASMATNVCGEIVIRSFQADKSAWKHTVNSDTVAGLGNMATGWALATSGTPNEDGKYSGEDKAMRGAGWAIGIAGAFDALYSAYRNYTAFDDWLEVMSQEHANSTQTMLANAGEIADNIVLNALNAEAASNRAKFGNSDLDRLRQRGFNVDDRPTTLNKEQIVAAINGLSSNYITDFRSKAIQTFQGGKALETFLKQANEYGWWMAGYSVIQMANLNDAANQIALNVPESSSNLSSPNPQVTTDHNTRYMSKANQYLELSEVFKNDGFRLPTVNKSIQDSISNDTAHQNSGGSLTMLLEDYMLKGVNFMINDQEHPIIQLKRLGSLMIVASTTIFTVMTVKLNKTQSSAVYLISMVAWGLFSILLLGGISLCYVLPMLPAIIWTGMLVGWLFMVMELMVIMPMWALTNVSLHSGQDFVGNQKIGYTMLLTMVLRAPLMTIGVIMMITLMNVFGIFINHFYTLIYSMSQISANGLANVFLSMFVAPMMYAGMIYISTKEIMTLMYKIPDNTLSIFGGGGQSLGSYGEKMSGGSVAVFGQMNSAAVQPLSSARNTLAEHRQAINSQRSVEGDAKHRFNEHLNKVDEIMRTASAGGKDGFSGANNAITGQTADKLKSAVNNHWDDYLGKEVDGTALIGASNDNDYTFKHAKDSLIPARDDIKDRAIDKALHEAHQYKESNNGGTMSYVDFFNSVNRNINEEVFGKEEATKLQRHADILDVVNGNNEAGNSFMKDFHEKMHGIADREEMDVETLAPTYVKEFNTAMNDYAKSNGFILHPDNPHHSSQFSSAELQTSEKMQSVGRTMNSLSRSYVRGHNGKSPTDPSEDRYVYDSVAGAIRRRNTDFGMEFGTVSGQERIAAAAEAKAAKGKPTTGKNSNWTTSNEVPATRVYTQSVANNTAFGVVGGSSVSTSGVNKGNGSQAQSTAPAMDNIMRQNSSSMQDNYQSLMMDTPIATPSRIEPAAQQPMSMEPVYTPMESHGHNVAPMSHIEPTPVSQIEPVSKPSEPKSFVDTPLMTSGSSEPQWQAAPTMDMPVFETGSSYESPKPNVTHMNHVVYEGSNSVPPMATSYAPEVAQQPVVQQSANPVVPPVQPVEQQVKPKKVEQRQYTPPKQNEQPIDDFNDIFGSGGWFGEDDQK